MKIYTKTGDKGTTQVYTSQVLRLDKNDAILECYWSIDELNSHIGLLSILLIGAPSEQQKPNGQNALNIRLNEFVNPAFMFNIQQTLFSIGFAISDKPQIDNNATEALEIAIDAMQSELPTQTKFILPGGTQAASQAHICRTVTRRAERTIVTVAKQQNVPEICIQYLNRLSDYFFVAARYLNHRENHADIEV
jgi:cob(I)alamin adenosyltransferase